MSKCFHKAERNQFRIKKESLETVGDDRLLYEWQKFRIRIKCIRENPFQILSVSDHAIPCIDYYNWHNAGFQGYRVFDLFF